MEWSSGRHLLCMLLVFLIKVQQEYKQQKKTFNIMIYKKITSSGGGGGVHTQSTSPGSIAGHKWYQSIISEFLFYNSIMDQCSCILINSLFQCLNFVLYSGFKLFVVFSVFFIVFTMQNWWKCLQKLYGTNNISPLIK